MDARVSVQIIIFEKSSPLDVSNASNKINNLAKENNEKLLIIDEVCVYP